MAFQQCMLWLSVASGLLAIPASAHSRYKQRLPNGAENRVQHEGGSWNGVGHHARFGSGPLNDFGMAFRKAGRAWTRALCEADTDGDGQSNGMELGDPDCVWREGETPSRTTDISHPGYSESMTRAAPRVELLSVKKHMDEIEINDLLDEDTRLLNQMKQVMANGAVDA